MSIRFTVYSRAQCHLCDVLVGELRAATAGHDVDIAVVDVDGDEALREAYGFDVPVLTADDEEICRHRLDPDRLRAWLEAARQEAVARGPGQV